MLRPLPFARIWWRVRVQHRPFSFTAHQYAEVQHTSHIPSFRQQITRTTNTRLFSDRLKFPSVRNQVLCFIYGSILVYWIAARETNVETYVWSTRLQDSGMAWKYRAPTNDEMRRARYYQFGKSLQAGLASLNSIVKEWPQTIKGIVTWAYVQVAQPILDTSEGRRVCWGIGAANTLVWLAWQMPRMQPLLTRSFVHNPMSGLSYTLFTSIFSHKSIIHLFINSMALSAFGAAVSHSLAKRQTENPTYLREATVRWHFLAFFISAGVFSGLVSHVVAMRFIFPRLVSRLSASASNTAPAGSLTSASSFASAATARAVTSASTIASSHGASGAIYATLALTALEYPDTEIAMAIPPTFPLPVTWGVGALVAVDILGVLRGWRRFNHWAHLGGVAFGALYHAYGPQTWEYCRLITLGRMPRSLSKQKEQ